MSESTKTGQTPRAGAVETTRAEAPPSADDSKPANHWATLWLCDRDIAVFTGLAAIVLVLLIVRWAQLSGWGSREIEIERLTPIEHVYRFDVNEATWVEFAQLEDIGESLALAIVADREKNGPFARIEDLDRVKGIGPRTVERMRAYVRVDEPEAAQE